MRHYVLILIPLTKLKHLKQLLNHSTMFDATRLPMDIYPGIGLSNIRFGITEVELIALIGEPDKAWDDPETEGGRKLQYNPLRCTFWFDDTNLH